jgi:hypothetical protein
LLNNGWIGPCFEQDLRNNAVGLRNKPVEQCLRLELRQPALLSFALCREQRFLRFLSKSLIRCH